MKTTTLSLYLDTRRLSVNTPAPLRIIVRRDGKSAFIQTGIRVLPAQWDSDNNKVVKSPLASRLNLHIGKMMLDAETILLKLKGDGKIASMTASTIRDTITEAMEPGALEDKEAARLFRARLIKYAESRERETTKKIYLNTLNLLDDFDNKLSDYTFEDIDRDFIQNFIKRLVKSGMKQNSINIHLRNIRAVFNAAIDDDITSTYPFRKIKIKAQATADRSMSVSELRKLLNTPVAPWQQEYVDMFFLMFCLRGINIGDLALLTEIKNGRVEYIRQKTNRRYTIKLEPEAMRIIDKYRGEKYLLSILDRYSNYHDYAKHLNKGLQSIGKQCNNGKKYTGEALFPNITTYWARYSWASLAAELDIPRETIAAGLGHSWADVTSIYVRTDMTNKVDRANRKILDLVYKKRSESHDTER